MTGENKGYLNFWGMSGGYGVGWWAVLSLPISGLFLGLDMPQPHSCSPGLTSPLLSSVACYPYVFLQHNSLHSLSSHIALRNQSVLMICESCVVLFPTFLTFLKSLYIGFCVITIQARWPFGCFPNTPDVTPRPSFCCSNVT